MTCVCNLYISTFDWMPALYSVTRVSHAISTRQLALLCKGDNLLLYWSQKSIMLLTGMVPRTNILNPLPGDPTTSQMADKRPVNRNRPWFTVLVDHINIRFKANIHRIVWIIGPSLMNMYWTISDSDLSWKLALENHQGNWSGFSSRGQ